MVPECTSPRAAGGSAGCRFTPLHGSQDPQGQREKRWFGSDVVQVQCSVIWCTAAAGLPEGKGRVRSLKFGSTTAALVLSLASYTPDSQARERQSY